MPRRDGTGPMGAGAMTGRGLGLCTGANAVKCGAGIGMGLGLGIACKRGLCRGRKAKRFLNQQNPELQAQMNQMEKQ